MSGGTKIYQKRIQNMIQVDSYTLFAQMPQYNLPAPLKNPFDDICKESGIKTYYPVLYVGSRTEHGHTDHMIFCREQVSSGLVKMDSLVAMIIRDEGGNWSLVSTGHLSVQDTL